MRNQQSLPAPAPSSTAYKLAGLDLLHCVDDLTPVGCRTSKECSKHSKGQHPFLDTRERVRTLDDVLASSDCDEEFADDRSPIGNLIRSLRKMAADPSSSAYWEKYNFGVWNLLQQNHMDKDEPNQRPMLASLPELGLKSQFLTHGTDFFDVQTGARSTDHRTWTDGFDATIFCKSARLQDGNKTTPFLTKYTLSGDEQKYQDRNSTAAIYGRNRAAFHQFLEHVKPLLLPTPMWTADFTRLADYFFKGRPLDESFEEYNRTATRSGDDRREGYTIDSHCKSAWTEFIEEVSAAAAVESDARKQHIPVFMNTAHKNFGMFIQDVILANEMNAAMKLKGDWHSMKVYAGQAHVEATRILDKCKSITNKDVKRISRLRAADEKAARRVKRPLVTTQVLSITDITDGDELEDADANAKAAAAQLLAEHDAELCKSQSEKKSKSRKRKPKAKGISSKPTSQTQSTESTEQAKSSKQAESSEQSKPSDEVKNPIQSKIKTSSPAAGQEPLERLTIKKPEGLAGDSTAVPPKSATVNDVKKKPQGKTNAMNKATVSSKPVVTLSDYEDAPIATQSSTNETEGWQTVKKSSKPKPAGVTTVRASSGGIPGANYGPQRGLNPSIGSGRQINRQTGNMNGPANQPTGFRLAARNASSSAQNKVNPAASKSTEAATASKPVVHTPVVDQPEPYENAFPPIELEADEQTTTRPTLKITPVVPQRLAKSSVVAKGKNVKKVSENAVDGEKSTREDGSDLNLTSKKITDDVSDNADGISTSKHGSNVASASKNEVSGDVLKTSTPKPDTVPNSASKMAEKKSIDSERGTQAGPTDEIVKSKDDFLHSTTEKTQAPVATSVSSEENAPTNISSLEHEDLSQFQESFNDGQSSEEPSHLDENYPVTPQCPASSRQVHVKDVADTLADVEAHESTPSKEVDDPLSWVGASLTSPVDFEGRPRGNSLPQDAYHSPGIFGDTPPYFRQRTRGQSLRSQLCEEDDDGSEGNSSAVPEEVGSPRAEEPSIEAATSKKVPVVTIHPDNTYTAAPPVADASSQVSAPAYTLKYGLPVVVSTLANMDTSPLTRADGGILRDHPHHYLNIAPGSHSYLPGFIPAVPNMPNAQASNGGIGHGLEPTTAPLFTQGGPQQSYSCTQCSVTIVPTVEKPMVFCSGCGPTHHLTYCSVACLLVDAYDHASDCWNMPAAFRICPHVFPPGSPYVYETNPVMSEDMTSGTREKFRQRTFLLYARYGPWPDLAAAWCRKHVEWPISTAAYPVTPELRKHHHASLIDWEEQKRCGVYHIFWSGAFDKQFRGNPKADVIYTVAIDQANPQKRYLSRVLHALMVRDEGSRKPMASFAYRMIRHYLTTPALYVAAWENAGLVLSEFERQFQLEFNFNRSMDWNSNIPFDFNHEVFFIMPFLNSIESSFSTLRYWDRDWIAPPQ